MSPTYILPKNSAVEEVSDEMTAHFTDFGWSEVDEDAVDALDDSVFHKSQSESVLSGGIEYSVDVYVFQTEEPTFYRYYFKSFANIKGIRRTDVEDLDMIRDSEIKEYLTESNLSGLGLGPKTIKRMIAMLENRVLSQANKILNMYCRKED